MIVTEAPVSTPVAAVWLQTVNVMLLIKEAHEEGGAVEGQEGEYAWNFDAKENLVSASLCLDQYQALTFDELHTLNHLPEHRGAVQFQNGDNEGEFQISIVAKFLESIGEEVLDRAGAMLNGGMLEVD